MCVSQKIFTGSWIQSEILSFTIQYDTLGYFDLMLPVHVLPVDIFGLEEGQSKKEFFKSKCHQLLFGWECCSCWYQFAHLIELFIMDAFVDLFITLCIVVNTLFMAMEHDGMTPTMVNTLKIGNYVSDTTLR